MENAGRMKNTIGIVGGGKGGMEMISLFSASDSCVIQFVTDIDKNAPAIVRAKKLGIHTSVDTEKTIRSKPVNFIIEATGSRKVFQIIKDSAPEGTEILGSATALFMFNMLEENRVRTNRAVSQDVGQIKSEITKETHRVAELLSDINEISITLKILALNSSVEAARAGEHGTGFAVFAGEIKSIADETKSLLQKIEKINSSIAELSVRIEFALARLG